MFFYKNRIPFRVADCPTFHAALELTRPGLENKRVLTRKKLAGPLLDRADQECHSETKDKLKGRLATTSQDGWSNVHMEPIIASTVQCEGKSYPLDSVEPGAERKTAAYCFDLAKKSIEYAESSFEVRIVGFVSDNESKMLNLRNLLGQWRPSLIVYGCAAHYLNLVRTTANDDAVTDKITEIQKCYREHHRANSMLRQV